MGSVRITKTSVEDYGTEIFEITVPSYETLGIKTGTPVFVQNIPEEPEENTILVKVVGNTQRIKYSFKIVPLSTNLVTGGDLASEIETKTVENQMGFLLNLFRPKSLKDKYKFEIINPNILLREGTLESLDIDFEKNDPNNPLCTMSFVTGSVITTIDENVPQRPPASLLAIDFDNSGNTINDSIKLIWTTVPVDDEGGSSITGYRVERKGQTTSWQELTSSAMPPYVDTSVVSGATYLYRVSAINSQGVGKTSKVVKHVAAP